LDRRPHCLLRDRRVRRGADRSRDFHADRRPDDLAGAAEFRVGYFERNTRTRTGKRMGMILFPAAFFQAIVLGAILLVGLGAVLLIALLILDYKNKRIW